MNMTRPQVRIANLVMLEYKEFQIKPLFDEYDASPGQDWQAGDVGMQRMPNKAII